MLEILLVALIVSFLTTMITVPWLIKKLAEHLQTTDISSIIGKFSDKLMSMIDREYPANIDEYVEALSEELSFHKSVNLITEYKLEDTERDEESSRTFQSVNDQHGNDVGNTGF